MLTQEKVDKIVSVLPHGSGINYDYKIRVGGARLYVSNGYDVYDICLDDIGYCYDDRIVRVNCTLESRTFREPFIVQLYINLELLTRLSRVPGELLEFHHIYRTTYQLMEKHIGTHTLNNL